MQNTVKKTVILTGPTATGKTALAIDFALKSREKGLALEIINADSLLVYKHFDIGTAKPTLQERTLIPHHLIDIVEPEGEFNANEFSKKAKEAITSIEARGARALIVGGTGFYLQALMYGIWEAPSTHPEFRKFLEKDSTQTLYTKLSEKDPEALVRIHAHDRYRIVRALEILEFSGKKPSDLQKKEASRTLDPRFDWIVIDRHKEELETRVSARTKQMIEQGLVDETKLLLEKFPQSSALRSVGYVQCVDHLRGKKPEGRTLRPGLLGLEDEINLATLQLVKSQRTWFKNQLKKQVPQGSTYVLPDTENEILERLFQQYFE